MFSSPEEYNIWFLLFIFPPFCHLVSRISIFYRLISLGIFTILSGIIFYYLFPSLFYVIDIFWFTRITFSSSLVVNLFLSLPVISVSLVFYLWPPLIRLVSFQYHPISTLFHWFQFLDFNFYSSLFLSHIVYRIFLNFCYPFHHFWVDLSLFPSGPFC